MKIDILNWRGWRGTETIWMNVGNPTLPLCDLEMQLSTKKVLPGSTGSPGTPVRIQWGRSPLIPYSSVLCISMRGCRQQVSWAKGMFCFLGSSKEELHRQGRRRCMPPSLQCRVQVWLHFNVCKGSWNNYDAYQHFHLEVWFAIAKWLSASFR